MVVQGLSQVRHILNYIDANVLIFQHQKIILGNEALLSWLQISHHDLVQLSLVNLVSVQSYDSLTKPLQQLLDGTTSKVTIELVFEVQPSTLVSIEATIKLFDYLDSADDSPYFIMTFTPEQIVADSNNTQYIVEGIELNPQSTISKSLKNYALNGVFLEDALDNFFNVLHSIVAYDSASIVLQQSQKSEFIASRGLPADISLEQLSDEIDVLGNKISSKSDILHQTSYGTAYVTHNTQLQSEWVKVDGTEHIKSWMGIELRNDDEFIGWLNLDSSQTNFFTKDHAREALAISQQIVLILVYMRLYQQFFDQMVEREKLQHALMDTLINSEIQYAAQDLIFTAAHPKDTLLEIIQIIKLGWQSGEVGLWVDGKLIHDSDGGITSGMLQSYLQQIRDGAIVIRDDIITLQSYKPIILSEDVQALAYQINERDVIFAVRRGQGDLFLEADIELLKAVATQLNIALEKASLTDKLREQTQHLSHLVEEQTKEIRFNERRLQAILDSTADGIFYMEDFQIKYANPAFSQMVGYTSDELQGKPLSEIRVLPEASENPDFEALLGNHMMIEPERSETQLRHKTGATFYANIRFSLIGTPGDNPVRMVAIARDISQERQLYFQRARFIANAAHELRTPLSSLILRLHMLRKQPERVNVHLESLDKVTDYLRDLVEELLTLSRFERGLVKLEKNQFVLQTIIQEAIESNLDYAQERYITIDTNLPEENVNAIIDGGYTKRMMDNLIKNALNYSNDEGSVEITLRVQLDDALNYNAIIIVEDDGQGIDIKLLPNEIFDPFVRPSQGSRKETGMGLAMVREIVEAHGGKITADNRPQGGSIFSVTLPIDG